MLWHPRQKHTPTVFALLSVASLCSPPLVLLLRLPEVHMHRDPVFLHVARAATRSTTSAYSTAPAVVLCLELRHHYLCISTCSCDSRIIRPSYSFTIPGLCLKHILSPALLIYSPHTDLPLPMKQVDARFPSDGESGYPAVSLCEVTPLR